MAPTIDEYYRGALDKTGEEVRNLESARYFFAKDTGDGSGFPVKYAFRLASNNAVAAVRASGARPAQCGVTTTFSNCRSSGSIGGTAGPPPGPARPPPPSRLRPQGITHPPGALAERGRLLHPPLILPSARVHVPIGLAQMAGRRHQQHHGGVRNGGGVRVGAIGDCDAPAPGFVQIDRFVTRADRADDLELRQHFHLVAAQAAAAIGQNGPHAFA